MTVVASEPAVVIALGPDAPAARLVTSLAQASVRPLAVVDDVAELPALVASAAPDAILVDLALAAPLSSGPMAAAQLGVPVVALCGDESPAALARALAAGVTVFVPRDAGAVELGSAIAAARAGSRFVSPRLLDRLLAGAAEALREGGGDAGREERAATLRATLLAPGSLYPVFQPIADLHGARGLGWLALTRFAGRPEEDTGRCFDEAAAAGLAGELEVAAAAAALDQFERLPGDALLFLKASCATVASQSLEPLLLEPRASRVVLELAGVADLDDRPAFDDAVGRLRHRGVRFAVDETGAGFGPLDQVLDLSPAFVRLAGGLTRGIDADRTRRALALAVISFAAHLGAKVIADRIETADELQALARLGVGYGLGFHIGRPGALPGPVAGPAGAAPVAEGSLEAVAGAAGTPVLWAHRGAGLGLSARAMSSFESAAAAVLRIVAERLDGATPYVGLLDRRAGLLRIVDSIAGAPSGLEVGASHPLEGSHDDLATSGRSPQTGPPDAAAVPAAGHWAVVPFAGTPDQPIATLSAVAPAPLGDEALQRLRDAAGALATALDKEHGGDPEVVLAALREHGGRDRFTGLLNAHRFREVLDEANVRALALGGLTHVVAVTVGNLEALAERHGQAVGGLVMKDVARSLALEAEHVDALARVGPTTFGCVLFGRRPSEIDYFCRSVTDRVAASGRRRGATVEMRTGVERLGVQGGAEDAWQVAIDRLFSV